jgi:hypothetical protein
VLDLAAARRLVSKSQRHRQHVVHFARALPAQWQPTDADPELRSGCCATASAALNVLPPLALDVLDAAWPVTAADAVLCINMIHIAPRRDGRAAAGSAPTAWRRAAILYRPYGAAGAIRLRATGVRRGLGRAIRTGVRDLDEWRRARTATDSTSRRRFVPRQPYGPVRAHHG